jgi:hypothetical protein
MVGTAAINAFESVALKYFLSQRGRDIAPSSFPVALSSGSLACSARGYLRARFRLGRQFNFGKHFRYDSSLFLGQP